MSKPHIWSVLCLLLYDQEGSLNLIKKINFVAYHWNYLLVDSLQMDIHLDEQPNFCERYVDERNDSKRLSCVG